VATGVITDAPESTIPREWHHQHVEDTKDGGLSPFFLPSSPRSSPPPSGTNNDAGILHASCHCTSVSLQITRPSPNLTLNPDSGYPDLLLPYITTPPETVSNPNHEKWYLRPVPSSSSSTPPSPEEHQPNRPEPKTKYLAGTCACAPCRLTSGFEIQTWAFIPRINISISPSPSQPHKPLDFTQLPTNHPLKAYESSPGRIREFCSLCGATVFWHDRFRPDLIDVSVGLLRAPEGARAESWLEWWTGRVSFSEDAGKGRAGGAKAWGKGIIGLLEEGLRRVGREQQGQQD
jgi:hypothetical protein